MNDINVLLFLSHDNTVTTQIKVLQFSGWLQVIF